MKPTSAAVRKTARPIKKFGLIPFDLKIRPTRPIMNQATELVIPILKSMSMDERPSALTPGTSYCRSTSTHNDTNLPPQCQIPYVPKHSIAEFKCRNSISSTQTDFKAVDFGNRKGRQHGGPPQPQ